MLRFLNTAFNVRRGEWGRLLLLYIVLFLFVVGATWGKAVIEAAFLEHVGIRYLPWVFALNSILFIIAMAAYTGFADRVANDKLMTGILALGVIGILTGIIAIYKGMVAIAYPLLYVFYFVVLVDLFNLHWATYVNGFYDTRTAKRLFPMISSASRIAGIVGGLTMPLINHIFSPTGIIAIWAGIIVFVIATILMFNEKRPSSSKGFSDSSNISYIANVREGWRYVIRSSFLKWMAISTFFVMVLFTLIYYRANEILLDQLKTTANISNFLGLLVGVSNLVIFPIQLFVISRLIGRIGLGNANIIFPFGTLFICGALIYPGNIIAASLAYLDRTVFRVAFHQTTNNLLYNAVPARIKGRARAVVIGVIGPLGALVGSAILLVPMLSKELTILALIGVFAIIYMLCEIIVRREYGKALINMLQQEDFSFLMSREASELSAADPETLAALRKKLENPPKGEGGHEFTVFMARLITEIGGDEAVKILGQIVQDTPDPRTRAALIEVLATADFHSRAVRQLHDIFSSFLTDPNTLVRQSAFTGLYNLTDPGDKEFVSVALKMLKDPDPSIHVRVLMSIARNKGFYDLTPAADALFALLAQNDPHNRVEGVRILGQVVDERAAVHLIQYMNDTADEVRLEAALAVEAISKKGIPEYIKASVMKSAADMLNDPVERIRQASQNILGSLCKENPDLYDLLTKTLSDQSMQIRTNAADILTKIGSPVIPSVHSHLNSHDPQIRRMAAVILSRINPEEFGPIVRSHVTSNLIAVYHNCSLAQGLDSEKKSYNSIGILSAAIKESNNALIDEIFYLLSSVHDPKSISIIQDSLRSEDSFTRANAIEALESITSSQTSSLIAPLFHDLSRQDLEKICKDTWGMTLPNAPTAIRKLMSDNTSLLIQSITAFALGEMGSKLAIPNNVVPKQAENQLIDKPKISDSHNRRKSRPLPDLFGAIADKPVDTPSNNIESEKNILFSLPEIKKMIEDISLSPAEEVRLAAKAAKRLIDRTQDKEETILLSTIEKIIFLKEVPFFQGMTIDHLKVLASVCEETFFEEDTRIFNPGDTGGVLYIVVNGKVGIEQEKRKGSFARIADISAHSYFGEMNFFDNNPCSNSAVALTDTLVLRLRREPLIALARQHPELSLELINVLSSRLREANDRIADLTRTRPRELHKLFDQFG